MRILSGKYDLMLHMHDLVLAISVTNINNHVDWL